MTLGERNAVVLDIVPAAALNLRDFVRGAGKVRDHRAPVKVTVAHTGECAAALLGELVELRGKGRGGVPGIQSLLTGGDGIDAVLCADGENVLELCNGASRCDYADVGLELTDAPVGVCGIFNGDSDMGKASADYLGDIFSYVAFVAAECADQLSVMLDDIAHKIAAHLTGTVLNDFYFAIHYNCLLVLKHWLFF